MTSKMLKSLGLISKSFILVYPFCFCFFFGTNIMKNHINKGWWDTSVFYNAFCFCIAILKLVINIQTPVLFFQSHTWLNLTLYIVPSDNMFLLVILVLCCILKIVSRHIGFELLIDPLAFGVSTKIISVCNHVWLLMVFLVIFICALKT